MIVKTRKALVKANTFTFDFCVQSLLSASPLLNWWQPPPVNTSCRTSSCGTCVRHWGYTDESGRGHDTQQRSWHSTQQSNETERWRDVNELCHENSRWWSPGVVSTKNVLIVLFTDFLLFLLLVILKNLLLWSKTIKWKKSHSLLGMVSARLQAYWNV